VSAPKRDPPKTFGAWLRDYWVEFAALISIATGFTNLISGKADTITVIITFGLVFYVPTFLGLAYYYMKFKALSANLELITDVDIPIDPSSSHPEDIPCESGQMFLVGASISAGRFGVVAELRSPQGADVLFRYDRTSSVLRRAIAARDGHLVVTLKNNYDKKPVTIHFRLEGTRSQ